MSHPLRERVVSEMHMRRIPPLRAGLCLMQTVRLVDPAHRGEERAWLASMPGLNLEAQTPQARHASAKAGHGVECLWERHSEASTASLSAPASESDPLVPAADGEPAARWLEAAPGGVIRATRIAIVNDEEEAATIVSAFGFSPPDLVSCRINAARIWSDFRVHNDGYGRLLIAAGDTDPADLGRLVQRLQELGNYRNLALLSLPLVQEHGEALSGLESRLATLAGQIAQADRDDAVLLNELSGVSGEVSAMTAATAFRLSATTAYSRIVADRLASTPCTPVQGYQTLGEFTDRRLLPAARTCGSFEHRLEALSQRIERSTSLLRTRVDLKVQAQNSDLLRSMEANAGRQVRLQQMVEGLSIVAVSYYAVSLLKLMLPALTSITGFPERMLAAAMVVPVVIAVAFVLRWRMRSLHD